MSRDHLDTVPSQHPLEMFGYPLSSELGEPARLSPFSDSNRSQAVSHHNAPSTSKRDKITISDLLDEEDPYESEYFALFDQLKFVDTASFRQRQRGTKRKAGCVDARGGPAEEDSFSHLNTSNKLTKKPRRRLAVADSSQAVPSYSSQTMLDRSQFLFDDEPAATPTPLSSKTSSIRAQAEENTDPTILSEPQQQPNSATNMQRPASKRRRVMGYAGAVMAGMVMGGVGTLAALITLPDSVFQ